MNREIGMAAGSVTAPPIRQALWRLDELLTTAQERSMSRQGMTLCAALLKMHASLNVRNQVFQLMTIAGSSSTA
jgi:hypothetical protein